MMTPQLPRTALHRINFVGNIVAHCKSHYSDHYRACWTSSFTAMAGLVQATDRLKLPQLRVYRSLLRHPEVADLVHHFG